MANTSGIKPLVTGEMALVALQPYFDEPVHNLQPVTGGHVAQTFSFTVVSGRPGDDPSAKIARDYIVRFNATMLVNFEKEAYVYENFASPTVPIPRVVHVGLFGDIHFAITEKAPGRNLLQIPRSDYLALIPGQIEVLDAIHHMPPGDRPGYGIFDGNGVAHWPSWRAHLEFVREEEPAGDFFENWHSLFETSFLERDLFERLHSRMAELIGYCPEERYLVHGNYGFGNVLAQDRKITAIADWMNARYGDFLYDVAWLDFWSPADGWYERFHSHYRRMQLEVPSYSERIMCYQCYITLDVMKFYAKAEDKTSYDYVTGRIPSLLNN